MSKRFLFTILTLVIIVAASGLAIFLAKGYTFSPKEKRIVGTGIITIKSSPDAASVFIDGHLTTATNATIPGLSPKTYQVRVVKEGFIPWERSVEVKEGLVSDLKLILFPAQPTIYPLTFSGVKNPILSPDGEKLAYVVPLSSTQAIGNKKAGVWVWTMVSDRPIAFARSSEPHQIAQSLSIDYTNAFLDFSPDSKQIMAKVGSNHYILDENRLNQDPRDITPVLTSTLKSWADDKNAQNQARVLNIKDFAAKHLASNSAVLKWAPDETKFIYRKNALTDKEKEGEVLISNFKVYDLEDNKQYDVPSAKLHFWLPDSRHIVLVESDQVSIIDFDSSNKAVLFAGKFDDNYVYVWPDSSRLILVSSFPTPTASSPNLYGINLK